MISKIDSIELLKKLASDGCDCFILLRFNVRSSKHIYYDQNNKQFEIFNLIDGSEQVLTEKTIMDKGLTNVGHAIMNGVFYKDD